MADNTDNLSMGNFSIQDTMEMGMGNQELLNDLFSPETSTSNPEDVTPIIKDAEPATPPAKPAVPKGKEITPVEDDADDKEKGQSLISNFLGDNTDEDEEDDDTPSAPVAKTATPDAADDEEDSQSNQFSALANDLFKLGVFNKDEDEDDEEPITTPEQFLERFETEKKRGATEMVQNFISQFGEDYQEAFDAIFVKGVNPKEYFGTYNQVVNFAEMDLSEESNQIRIMKQALADQGFDADDIDSEVERLQNYGDLESVATKHHKVLVKKKHRSCNTWRQNLNKSYNKKQPLEINTYKMFKVSLERN